MGNRTASTTAISNNRRIENSAVFLIVTMEKGQQEQEKLILKATSNHL